MYDNSIAECHHATGTGLRSILEIIRQRKEYSKSTDLYLFLIDALLNACIIFLLQSLQLLKETVRRFECVVEKLQKIFCMRTDLVQFPLCIRKLLLKLLFHFFLELLTLGIRETFLPLLLKFLCGKVSAAVLLPEAAVVVPHDLKIGGSDAAAA